MSSTRASNHRRDLVGFVVAMAGRLATIAAILSACTRPNPEFCDDDRDCNNGEVCNLDVHRCIEAPPDLTCSTNDECPLERPICGDVGACRSCVTDDECSTGVCRSDGTCELSERILYVRPNGIAMGTCGAAGPCSLEYARSLLSAERTTIRLFDGTYPLAETFLVHGGMNVSVVGNRAAIVQRNGLGTSFDVMGIGTTATLRGFTLNRGLSCSDATLEVTRMALNSAVNDVRPWIASTACTLFVADSELADSLDDSIYVSSGTVTVMGTKIERSMGDGVEVLGGSATIKTSTITRSRQLGVTTVNSALVLHRSMVSYNRLGGVRSTQGSFNVVNNFVFRNGDPGASTFGGMHLDSASTTSRVMHNTVLLNDCDVSLPALSGGLYCRIGTTGTAYGNLIANNYRGNTSFQNAQTGGTCDFTYSLVAETTLSLGCVLASEECHLAGAASPAVNAGMSLGVMEDFDGEPRSDGKPDMGADEVQP